jgi:hypothetical protein
MAKKSNIFLRPLFQMIVLGGGFIALFIIQLITGATKVPDFPWYAQVIIWAWVADLIFIVGYFVIYKMIFDNEG